MCITLSISTIEYTNYICIHCIILFTKLNLYKCSFVNVIKVTFVTPFIYRSDRNGFTKTYFCFESTTSKTGSPLFISETLF